MAKKLTMNDFINEIKSQKEMWKKNAKGAVESPYIDYENALKSHHYSEAMTYILQLYQDMTEDDE